MAPAWLEAAIIRPCYFEPTFHKHQGKLCSGLQIHTDFSSYDPLNFRPYRIAALILKAIRKLYPDYQIWRDFPYEYENDRLAVDLLAGGPFLRQWVDDPQAGPDALNERLSADEEKWRALQSPFLLY